MWLFRSLDGADRQAQHFGGLTGAEIVRVEGVVFHDQCLVHAEKNEMDGLVLFQALCSCYAPLADAGRA